MVKISKTKETKKIEKKLWEITKKTGVFGCYEVTIGFGGRERVDYLTYDTKGIWRCYEIKVSKSDFYSNAAVTFVGHYNYYVIPFELYDVIKEDIPKEIGVYLDYGSYLSLKKNPKKQVLGVDEEVLKSSLIRSLYRENEKFIKISDKEYVNKMENKVEKYRREVIEYKNKNLKYREVINLISKKYKINYGELRKFVRDNV